MGFNTGQIGELKGEMVCLMTSSYNKSWIMGHSPSGPCHKWHWGVFEVLIGCGSLMSSQCAAPTRNQGLLQMAWWLIKAFTPLTGRCRAKGPQPLKVFFSRDCSKTEIQWKPSMILCALPCNLEGVPGFFGQVPRRHSNLGSSVNESLKCCLFCVSRGILREVYVWC